MRSKWLFRIVALLVFGGLVLLGALFYGDPGGMFWIVEAIAVLAVVLFVVLYLRLVKPYEILLTGMGLLGEQDFSSRLRHVQNKEADRLIDIFNRMMMQLKNERSAVREKNRFLDLLIEASPQGVLMLDSDGRITDINPAGMELLGIGRGDVAGTQLAGAPFELAPALAALGPGEDVVVRTSSMSLYRCMRRSFVDRGCDHPFILIEELTRELLRAEKASYENIIRMMSHEVNNSVGAIGSTLDVVAGIVAGIRQRGMDDVAAAVEASSARCGNLTKFISNLAAVVRIPEPVVSPVSLNELVCSVGALTRLECADRGVDLTLAAAEPDATVMMDGIQMEQVLVNVVKNAYESTGPGGRIRIIARSDPPSVTVEDDGPGISDEVRRKLFTPFFTTKATGQGIGLMFVREVLLNHGACFGLDTKDGLTKFEIRFGKIL